MLMPLHDFRPSRFVLWQNGPPDIFNRFTLLPRFPNGLLEHASRHAFCLY